MSTLVTPLPPARPPARALRCAAQSRPRGAKKGRSAGPLPRLRPPESHARPPLAGRPTGSPSLALARSHGMPAAPDGPAAATRNAHAHATAVARCAPPEGVHGAAPALPGAPARRGGRRREAGVASGETQRAVPQVVIVAFELTWRDSPKSAILSPAEDSDSRNQPRRPTRSVQGTNAAALGMGRRRPRHSRSRSSARMFADFRSLQR
jgi:hypothetical protein